MPWCSVGTTVARLELFVCAASATTGRRLMISRSLKPLKSQYTMDRALG